MLVWRGTPILSRLELTSGVSQGKGAAQPWGPGRGQCEVSGRVVALRGETGGVGPCVSGVNPHCDRGALLGIWKVSSRDLTG